MTEYSKEQIETIRKQLELEWTDHFNTRDQSWKVLHMVFLLLIGLIGTQIKFDNIWVTVGLGSLVLFSSITGLFVSYQHWIVQENIFGNMNNLEKALDLHTPALLNAGHYSSGYHWTKIFNPMCRLVPVFIVRLHILVVVFTIFFIGYHLLEVISI